MISLEIWLLYPLERFQQHSHIDRSWFDFNIYSTDSHRCLDWLSNHRWRRSWLWNTDGKFMLSLMSYNRPILRTRLIFTSLTARRSNPKFPPTRQSLYWHVYRHIRPKSRWRTLLDIR
jgi:hypothetical protein